ncbi:MAG: DUF4249 family protein, partial [Bacteroidales bacterium]|nr:DUF4249 family protein [Bacteroidales bacterium]
MQNIKFIIISFLIASGISFFGCTERMDINVNDALRQLAIYGSITTDTMQHAISVMRSSNYFSNSAPEGISGAAVTISNGDEVFTLTESPSEKGVYLTASDVFGTEGNTYTLKVVVDFNGVTDEYTATSLLPRAVQVDSFKLQPSNISNNINALLYGKFPEIGNNYMNILAYKNNHIPLNDKLSDFNIIVSENRDSQEIDGAACMRFHTKQDEDRAYIEKGDLITIQVCSITK